MAHFAKINENNEVLTILYLNDKDTLDENNNEIEIIGQQYLEKHNNWPAHLWIKTSYNTRKNKYYNLNGTEGDQSKAFRGNYASVGSIWDPENQIFFDKKPYSSWVKNINEARWQSPIGDAPSLTEEQKSENTLVGQKWEYKWNDTNQSWDLINHSL